jgi:polysaccharide export outer membrane protein
MLTTLLGAFLAAGTLQTQTAQQPSATAPPPPMYVVGAQDQLSITVFEEPALSGKYRVENDGFFTFPLLDRVAAGGRTLSEVQADLTTRLANGYLRNPQVRVEIDQYKSRRVFVTGEVRAPNEYTMTGTMTLLQALALAGSPTANAGGEVIVSRQAAKPAAEPSIIRLNRRDLELGKAGYDLMLQDGDIINIPAAQRFFISGFVRNPGPYVFEPGMTIQQAIALAGGLTDRGSDRRIAVSRILKGKVVDVSSKLEDKLEANDTVHVPQRFF